MVSTLRILVLLCPYAPDPAAMAQIIDQEFAGVVEPALAAAIAREESSCRRGQVGPKGSIGEWMVNPLGQALYRCTAAERRSLRNRRVNARCAAKIIRFLQTRCGPDPRRWLSAYRGHRHCRPTTYSRRVLSRITNLQAEDRTWTQTKSTR